MRKDWGWIFLTPRGEHLGRLVQDLNSTREDHACREHLVYARELVLLVQDEFQEVLLALGYLAFHGGWEEWSREHRGRTKKVQPGSDNWASFEFGKLHTRQEARITPTD